jgi:3-oxoacyl-[acyl-carrier protein] reductase
MSQFDLTDKIAIVTGSGNGIGRGIALAFADAGAHVVVASRNQENLDQVAAAIREKGRKSLAIATDICNEEQVNNLISQTVDTFGQLDIMVNNAGVGDTLRVGKPEDLPLDAWKATIELNLTGTFACSIAAGKVMIGQKSGKIINISSVAGIKDSPNFVHYGAAKAGVINLTKSMAASWAPHNININCIAPGLTATEGVADWLPPDKDKDGRPVPPLQFPADPEHVAHLAVFLASEASERITGECIPIRALVDFDR